MDNSISIGIGIGIGISISSSINIGISISISISILIRISKKCFPIFLSTNDCRKFSNAKQVVEERWFVQFRWLELQQIGVRDWFLPKELFLR